MPPFLSPPPPWPVKPPTVRGYRDAGLAYALGWRREIGRRRPGRQRWGLRPKTVRHPRGAEPRLGAAEFLDAIRVRGYKIAVLTTRKRTDVIDWLARVGLLDKIDTVTNEKVPALVYIDDRALCFRGDFDDALEQLKSFKAHWEAADEP
jgi:hypothetical protein